MGQEGPLGSSICCLSNSGWILAAAGYSWFSNLGARMPKRPCSVKVQWQVGRIPLSSSEIIFYPNVIVMGVTSRRGICADLSFMTSPWAVSHRCQDDLPFALHASQHWAARPCSLWPLSRWGCVALCWEHLRGGADGAGLQAPRELVNPHQRQEWRWQSHTLYQSWHHLLGQKAQSGSV